MDDEAEGVEYGEYEETEEALFVGVRGMLREGIGLYESIALLQTSCSRC